MISNTQIKKRKSRKTNPEIVATLHKAKEHKEWNSIAKKVSGGTRRYSSVNITQIEEATKAGDRVVIIGKVLGAGELTKKVRVCALGFSALARAKIADAKGEVVLLKDEIAHNPKAEGVKVLQ